MNDSPFHPSSFLLHHLTFIFLISSFIIHPSYFAFAVPAFPGAEGFGAQSVGGRGGRVIEVTNLKDAIPAPPGSLREALEASGPRIVVFRVGGTIDIVKSIRIDNPFVTIAGQTAPGGGITLKNAPGNGGAPIQFWANDTIVRYIRFRPGASAVSNSISGVDILGGENIILDHCSVSWAVDQNVTIWYDPNNVTFQNSIVSEGLLNSSHKKEGRHSMGIIVGGEPGKQPGNISLHHNLSVHNDERNPRLKCWECVIDWVNNVVYNPHYAGWVSGGTKVNFVNNFYKSGPDTLSCPELVITDELNVRAFVSGNLGWSRQDESVDDWAVVGGFCRYKKEKEASKVDIPFNSPLVARASALETYDQVIDDVGANARLDCQGNLVSNTDAVDLRIISDVKSGTKFEGTDGGLIDDPSEVGGWPSLAPGTPCQDTDKDGMPDLWETANSFDLNDPSDGPLDADGDAYTNIEEYLNGTNPRTAETSFIPSQPQDTRQEQPQDIVDDDPEEENQPITVDINRPSSNPEALVYPNPAVGSAHPVIRAVLGKVDSVEITIFDIHGQRVHSINIDGAPTGIIDGEYYYDYTWSDPKSSGIYFAVIHGISDQGTVRGKTKFAVVK